MNPVNDAPLLSQLDDQVINEDDSLTLTLSASDIDGDQLYYGASVDNNATVDLSGTSLTITPDFSCIEK